MATSIVVGYGHCVALVLTDCEKLVCGAFIPFVLNDLNWAHKFKGEKNKE